MIVTDEMQKEYDKIISGDGTIKNFETLVMQIIQNKLEIKKLKDVIKRMTNDWR